MKRIFYLSTCSTCVRILKELGDIQDFELIDIKANNITKSQLDELRKLTGGTYEDFFSRRAMKYRAWGLNEKKLAEKDIRDLITKEYTFLKRPVIQIGKGVFIGNTKKVVEAAKEEIES